MYKKITIPTILLASFLVVSCGGGGGSSGNSSPPAATIDSTNEEQLATAATEAAKQAVNNNNAPTLGSKPAAKMEDFALIQDFSSFCSGGGTASMNINESTGNGVISYSDCNMGGSIINGTVTITSSVSGNITTTTLDYNNFTMTFAGQTQSFDLLLVCEINTNTQSSVCTYASDTLGIDGRTYSVSGTSVSGDFSSGYTVTATVTDPDYGSLTISTNTPITFNCTNGQPDSGEIQFSDGDGNTVTITYDSCTSFTVSYNGSSTPYSW